MGNRFQIPAVDPPILGRTHNLRPSLARSIDGRVNDQSNDGIDKAAGARLRLSFLSQGAPVCHLPWWTDSPVPTFTPCQANERRHSQSIWYKFRSGITLLSELTKPPAHMWPEAMPEFLPYNDIFKTCGFFRKYLTCSRRLCSNF
jgi:hypothetical protein